MPCHGNRFILLLLKFMEKKNNYAGGYLYGALSEPTTDDLISTNSQTQALHKLIRISYKYCHYLTVVTLVARLVLSNI